MHWRRVCFVVPPRNDRFLFAVGSDLDAGDEWNKLRASDTLTRAGDAEINSARRGSALLIYI
jgi:hypothetical protein